MLADRRRVRRFSEEFACSARSCSSCDRNTQTIYGDRSFVEAGGLLSHGIDYRELHV